jgi:hydroxyacylglutathione hydrolase
MFFQQVFEQNLAQYSYLIGCQATGDAIVIDPMRDIDRYRDLAAREGLEVVAAAETHIHADYLTGLREFAENGVHVYASDEGTVEWKYEWLRGSNYKFTFVNDDDQFSIGNIQFLVQHTPGHTPEHVSYLVTDGASADEPMGILSGDFVFVGDVGRPDLLETAAGPKGAMKSSACNLYQSVQKFKRLPEYLQVWPGHGAGSACGKAMGSIPESTVGYELRFNPSILASDTKEDFVDQVLEGQPEPPLYFSRMKRDNREGPAVLGTLPNPLRMEAAQVASELQKQGVELVDTRERTKFMDSNLDGSLLAPLNKSFNTVVGSYVQEDAKIYLVVDEENLDEAVRDLVRIGLDDIAGFVAPEDLEAYLEKSSSKAVIETIDFEDTARLLADGRYKVLDVRKATEFNDRHIGGAVNIAHTRLRDRMDELDKSETWLVHCHSGFRASVASALLRRDGYNVKYINDHIDQWEEKVAVNMAG